MRQIAVFSRPGGRLTIDGPGNGSPFLGFQVSTTEIIAVLDEGEIVLGKITEQGIKVQGLVFETFQTEVADDRPPAPATLAPTKPRTKAKAKSKAKAKPGPKPKAAGAGDPAPAKPKGKPGPKPGSKRKPQAGPAAANVAGASAAAGQQLDTAPSPDQAEEDLLKAIAEGSDPVPVDEAGDPPREELAEGDPDALTEAQLEAATAPKLI